VQRGVIPDTREMDRDEAARIAELLGKPPPLDGGGDGGTSVAMPLPPDVGAAAGALDELVALTAMLALSGAPPLYDVRAEPPSRTLDSLGDSREAADASERAARAAEAAAFPEKLAA
jgi:hypothetical protein